MQAEVDAAKAEAEQLVKTLCGELASVTRALTHAQAEKADTERAAELDPATVARN